MGKRSEGFFRFKIDSSTPFASFWIFGTTFLLIAPAPFEDVLQGGADLLFALVVDAQDLLQGNADVRDVFFDIRALLLGVGLSQPSPNIEPKLPTDVLQREPDLLHDLGIRGDRLLALGREGHPDRR